MIDKDNEYIGAPGGTEDYSAKVLISCYDRPEDCISKSRIRSVLERLGYEYVGKGKMKYSGNWKVEEVVPYLDLYLTHDLIASIGVILKMDITFERGYMVKAFLNAENYLKSL